ncbi:MAG: hypothetical protein ABJK28_15315 [Algibacter sp.]
MLDKSKRFKKTLGGFDRSKRNQFDFPEATPEILLEIRTKIRKQQRRRNVKIGIGFVVLTGGILVWVLKNIII